MHEQVQPVNDLIADAEAFEAITTRLGWLHRRRMEHELITYNLTVPQFIALRCLDENQDGCSMSELAESSHQVSATMTGIVDRLVERGLVERLRDPRDRRAMRVVLTRQGVELLERIKLQKNRWMQDLLRMFSPVERQQLIAFIRRYLETMERNVPPME